MPERPSSQSIAELEGVEWPPPPPRAPEIIAKCYELRKKPLSQLDASDLRTLISQDVGLALVMSTALDIVEHDPLLEVEHYRGDLLHVILEASPKFYAQRPDLKTRVEKILRSLPEALKTLDDIDFETSSEALEEGVARFRQM